METAWKDKKCLRLLFDQYIMQVEKYPRATVLIVVLDEAKSAGPEYARYVVDVRPSTSHASVVNLWSVCDRRTPVIRVHWRLPNCTETPAGCKW